VSRKLVLGPEPAVDPFKERTQPTVDTAPSTDVRWDDRTAGRPLRRVGVVAIFVVALDIAYPEGLLVGTASLLLGVLLLSRINGTPRLDGWKALQPRDINLSLTADGLEITDVKGRKIVLAMVLNSARTDLLGDLGALIRATDDLSGLCLLVSMKPEKASDIVQEDKISDSTSGFLGTLSEEALRAYFTRRGGLWTARAALVGYTRSAGQLSALESSFRAAAPDPSWRLLEPSELRSRIEEHEIIADGSAFYGTGEEMSKWLVQMTSELASEVGTNVPAEFVAPIREREVDYKLGFVMNPETLKLGPRVGFSHRDLEEGLLVCGGTQSERRRVLALLVMELLHARKRIIMVTNDPDAISLTGLSDGAVGLELGRDLVLNPIDPEGVPRTEYVPQLISALEVLAGTDLRGAVDLEIALNRAVALGTGTVADVAVGEPGGTSGTSEPNASSGTSMSRASLIGFEAVRALRQGSGARAFYGMQTVPVQTLADAELVVIVLSLGSEPLERFAWDLLSMKLAGLRSDSDLIIMLDNPENLRVRNSSFGNRDVWSESVVHKLRNRGPTVVALDHPADMATGAIGSLSSCLSLRLRESPDLRVASDLLGFGVIATGLHSKARQSSRETSFLRVMEADMSVVARGRSEIGIPLKLDESPSAMGQPPVDEMTRRVSRISPHFNAEEKQAKTLLEHVAGADTDLAVSVLRLLTRYEPLTEEAIRKFIWSNKHDENADVEGVLARLEKANMILRGHEVHGGVSYMNFRVTMKGTMALRQIGGEEGRDVRH